MTTRIGRPEYGGTFAVEGGASLRFVLAGELIAPDSSVVDASPGRVPPRCQHFGACGGCDYQHADYAEQIRIKSEVLLGVLADAGVSELPPLQILTADPWEYRNRIRLRVETIDGSYRTGYNRRGSREFLPIVECPIASPLLMRAREALEGADTVWLASIEEVEFHASANSVSLQMSVFTRDGRTAGFAAFCEALQATLPELTGAGVMAASAGFGAKERAIWGATGLVQEVLGRRYWVTRGAFFQVNRHIVGKLAELVTANRSGTLAWDLYAGVGLFSRALLETFATVAGVESSEPAASDLAALAKKNKSFQSVANETVTFLRGALVQRETPSLIVMDPPRAGLGAEVCDLLGRIAAPAVVYVSCDPLTLARDLALLTQSGYCIAKLHLVDMFPQTFHLETVVFLSR